MGATTVLSERAEEEWRLRVDLAAAFRIIANWGWEESVGNHLSVAIRGRSSHFLLNPRWQHFKTITASDLLLLDARDPAVMTHADAPDPSAWAIHSQLHERRSDLGCVLHVHPPFATALASLADPTLQPIDQNTARFHGLIAYDLEFAGMADSQAEGVRLAEALGDRRILVMANHGVLVTAPTIAEALEDLYFLERACKVLMLAYSSNQPIRRMTPPVAEKTAQDWRNFAGMALAHFAHLKSELENNAPDYSR